MTMENLWKKLASMTDQELKAVAKDVESEGTEKHVGMRSIIEMVREYPDLPVVAMGAFDEMTALWGRVEDICSLKVDSEGCVTLLRNEYDMAKTLERVLGKSNMVAGQVNMPLWESMYDALPWEKAIVVRGVTMI